MLFLDRLDKVGHRINPNDFTLHNESDSAAKSFSFFNVMGGQKDSCPCTMHPGDELTDLASTGNVDAGRRFVEKQYGGIVNDPGGNGEFALHSLRIAGKLPARCIGKVECF